MRPIFQSKPYNPNWRQPNRRQPATLQRYNWECKRHSKQWEL